MYFLREILRSHCLHRKLLKDLEMTKKYTEYQIQDAEEEEIFTTRCFFFTIKILPSKAFHCYVNVSNRGKNHISQILGEGMKYLVPSLQDMNTL